MAPTLPPLLQRLVDKFSNSRDFTISVALHAILLAVFGGTALYQVTAEPEDFTAGRRLVEDQTVAEAPEPARTQIKKETTFDPNLMPNPSDIAPINPIITTQENPLTFSITQKMPFPKGLEMPKEQTPVVSREIGSGGMPPGTASKIKRFSKDWRVSGTGDREPAYQFTAYVGQYSGGDWNSTVRVVGDKIVTGSLPNLLYLMTEWSKDKIKTNYKNVEAIRLDDGDTIATTKPPFIFLTGTRDFQLTEKEVENLQKYVRIGGCIWGDSSLPGLRSRFDIAFRREMKRVIPDVDIDFEALPANHPIFTKAYFPGVKGVPTGLNFYQEPVMAMKLYGEIAILYTANDYGDMWQTGLNREGQIDLRRDGNGQYVAINPAIYQSRESYLRNITPAALETSFQFGTNVVIHLLTRWENRARSAPTL